MLKKAETHFLTDLEKLFPMFVVLTGTHRQIWSQYLRIQF